ncbi:hypothetical protein N7481_009131 [Penicillium waksmanii]|uniref:uncharacterized protein n=1 Tax=Penicillium waksmanii TaxID=69791 RepID=UPI0025490218|nr:uncharacterized protein N7481_009131 [Penicillium waksmanii]KAJ5975424.1 hypothetical protein N7481_009131 [Penicillium waksmanii]
MSNISFGSGNASLQLGINSGSVHYHAAEQPEPSPNPLSTVPFPRDPDFVERGTLLVDIQEKLSPPGARVALVGLGGIGKSQLAIECSYRLRDSSPQTWVFWIHASNAARVEQGFQRLADRVKIPGCQSPGVNIFRLVFNWLCDEKHGPWVLILDNVDDDSHLREPLVFSSQNPLSPEANLGSQFDGFNRAGVSGETLLQFIPRVPHGSILITTRSASVASRLVRDDSIVTVDLMNSSQASSLMRASLGNQFSQEGIEELCKALEFMPLAITQAGAYIKRRAPRCSVLQYLYEFRKNDCKKTRLLKHEGKGLQRDEQASNSILITWQISFQHVRRTRASAADLLSLMSFFDRQGIVESALRISSHAERVKKTSCRKRRRDSTDSDVKSDADYELGEDIVILKDFSFISSTEDAHTFQMHSLVQLATRLWLEDHSQISRWRNQFIENISYEFGSPGIAYAEWKKHQELFPHVKSALDHRPDSLEYLELWACLMNRGAAYAIENSNHQDGIRMASKALEARKSIFGFQHDTTLRSSATMGNALITGAQYKDAQSILETALADSEISCKEDTKVNIMYSLGTLYHFTGRLLKAEALLKEAVERTSSKAWASGHDSFICMHGLAKIYFRQGRYRESEELALRAMKESVKEFGEQDPATLGLMAVLAHLYFVQGQYKEAAALQEQALNSCEALFGKENIRTHEVRQALARTYNKQGHIAEAVKLYLQANTGYLDILGVGHEDALESSAELAEFFHSQGRLQDAVPILEKTIEICERLIGGQHSATIKLSSRLGHAYCLLSRFDEAESVLRNAQLALEKNVRGDSHQIEEPEEDRFSQMLTFSTLVTIYQIQRRFKEAEPLLARLVEVATEQYGENDSITMHHVERLVTNYKEQERWREVLPLQMRVFDLRKETLGEHHQDTLAAMEDLAETWKSIGRTDDAMKMVNTITTLRSEAANKTVSSMFSEP